MYMENDKEYLNKLTVQELILELCTVLHRYGYPEVSIGAMMRVMGVPEERAKRHDREYIELGEQFSQVLEEFEKDAHLHEAMYDAIEELKSTNPILH